MNLNSKRIVVSFGKEIGRCPVIEDEFPGYGELSGVEKFKYFAVLVMFGLTGREIILYGDLEYGRQYMMTRRAKKFFQLIQDMKILAADDLFEG